MIFGLSPVILLLIAVIIILGMILTLIRPTKRVELLRPRDRRSKTMPISRETDLGITCRKSKGVIHRYIKAGPSWVTRRGLRMVTKFFGVEGTAYTAIPKPPSGIETQKDADGNVVAHGLKINTEKFLRFLWGPKFYESLPQEARDPVEKDVIGITVEIGPIDEERWDLETLSADDINSENDSIVLDKLAGGQKPNAMANARTAMVWLIMGAFAMYFLVTRGII